MWATHCEERKRVCVISHVRQIKYEAYILHAEASAPTAYINTFASKLISFCRSFPHCPSLNLKPRNNSLHRGITHPYVYSNTTLLLLNQLSMQVQSAKSKLQIGKAKFMCVMVILFSTTDAMKPYIISRPKSKYNAIKLGISFCAHKDAGKHCSILFLVYNAIIIIIFSISNGIRGIKKLGVPLILLC